MLDKLMKALLPAKKMIDMFTYKIVSNQPIEQIAQKIPEACEKYKFALLQTYVYHEIVESKGFSINRKVFVYEICQAKTAAAMLTDFPNFAIFMPCKIATYEENDSVVISTMNMELMLDAVKSTPQLYKDATLLFGSLKTMMQSLSNN
jgi:uncharacterized protein (DUF302 family)